MSKRLVAGTFVIALATGLIVGQDALDYRRQLVTLISSSEWKSALRLAEQGLERYPNDPDLLVTAAGLLAFLGEPNQSEVYLETALVQSRLEPHLLRAAADLKLRSGRPSEALDLLRRALNSAPGDPLTHYRLAYGLLTAGRDTEALRQAQRAVEIEPDEPSYRRLYALLLDRLGQSQQAYRQLRAAQRLAPRDARLLLRLSDKERTAGRPSQALEYLELAAEMDPENPLYYSGLADLYRVLGLEKEASQSEALARQLETAFELYVEALQEVSRGDFERAAELLKGPVREHPEFLTGALLLGQALLKSGREDEALQVYLNILRQAPEQEAARRQGAWIQARRGEFSAALKILSEAKSGDLNRALWAGQEKLQEGDWRGALDEFRKVETQYPLDPRLLQLISQCLNQLGEAEAALSYLEKAHHIEPTDSSIEGEARDVRFGYLLRLLDEQKWQEASDSLAQLHREDPDEPQYLLYRAHSLQQLNRFSEAVTSYESGLQLDPSAEWARINLASCFYVLGDYGKAAEQWQWLLHQDDNPKYIYNLGLMRIRQFHLTEGWRLVEKAASRGFEPARHLLRRARR